MSRRSLIRCKHCSLTHEADVRSCPVTGRLVDDPARSESGWPRPPSPGESHAGPHSVYPWSEGESAPDVDPSELDTFIGRVVEGRYRVEALIGRGGMGAVFRAIDQRNDEPVALKILCRGYAKGSDAERRFLREARVASSLGHPNIAEVFALGHLDDGKPFFVMELLEGQSLAQRIVSKGAISEPEVVEIAEQIVSALEAAHEGGVVHRDLKPDNVFLVQRRGATVAKLLDFGVSKLLDGRAPPTTRTGVVVGTPHYLSPEQARGMHDLDHRVDLWAMGVLLYESLTGVLPFNAPSYDALLRKIIGGKPVPPSRFASRLTPELEVVVLRALSASREDRPESAGAMLALLRAAKEAHQGNRPDARAASDGSAVAASGPGARSVEETTSAVNGGAVDGPNRALLEGKPSPDE